MRHARREHLRAEPVPGEADPALRHERARRRAAARSTATAASGASGSTPRTTAPRSSSSSANGRAGEVYNVGGEEHENLEITERILELTGADAALVRHVDDRPGHDRRYSLDDSKLRCARLGARSARSRDGLAETVAWYRDHRAWWEPIKSGEYREYYEQQYANRLR